MDVIELGGINVEVLLALAGMFLGLAVAVQVLQEIYKYVTVSKARLYRIALRDFIGRHPALAKGVREDLSWVDRLYQGRLDEETRSDYRQASELFLRGPFQRREGARGTRLLPLEKKQLLALLDRTGPEWIREAIDVLKKERDIQKGQPDRPSPILEGLIEDLWSGYLEDRPSNKTLEFLEQWKVTGRPEPASADAQGEGKRPADHELKPKIGDPVDAAKLLEAFYLKFMPDRARIAEDFDQFAANFEHSYQRRNLRQTVILALLLTVGLNLPFSLLYRQARSLSPEEAAQLATSLVELSEASSSAPDDGKPGGVGAGSEPDGGAGEPEGGSPAAGGDGSGEGGSAAAGAGSDDDPEGRSAPPSEQPQGDPELQALLTRLREPIAELLKPEELEDPFFERGVDRIAELWVAGRGIPAFLGDCLVTALLISFGAPFWHRLSKALLGIRGSRAAAATGQDRS